jgi:signal transduction histidine kinase
MFWRLFLSSLACVLLSMALFTAWLSYRDAKDSLAQLRNQQGLLATIAASQIQTGYHDQIWPFEMLWSIAKEPQFVFWDIRNGSDKVVLSEGHGDIEFDVPLIVSDKPVWAMAKDERTEVWTVPLVMGAAAHPWTFRLGYHADQVRSNTRRTILSNVLLASAISVLLLFFSFLFTRWLMRPLQLLTDAATELDRGNLEVSLPLPSKDEIGRLINAFRSMVTSIGERDAAIRKHVESLQAARDELETRVEDRTRELVAATESLMEASRLAGKAEVATAVLHNVGNALNSVNTSAAVLAGMIENSSAPGLTRVSLLMDKHTDDIGHFLTDDPAGRHLPAYVSELAQVLESERKGALGELTSLIMNIDHIKAIVRMQQTHARAKVDVGMDVTMQELVEDALKVNGNSLQRHAVTLQREYGETVKLTVDRHKVIQILVNLLSNAKDAIIACKREVRMIVIRIMAEDNQFVSVSVTDNGRGIAEEDLEKIFSHGFTTKRDGHGFGLHSSAVAAIELGGSLVAHSEGPERGATFTLRLPLESPTRTEESLSDEHPS